MKRRRNNGSLPRHFNRPTKINYESLLLLGGIVILVARMLFAAGLQAAGLLAVESQATVIVCENLNYAAVGGRPDFLAAGLTPVYTPDREFWNPPGTVSSGAPDRATCLASGAGSARRREPNFIDIEVWPLDIRNSSAETVDQSLRWLIDTADWVREGAGGDLRISAYDTAPIRDYWTPVLNDPSAMAAWQAANDRLAPIVAHLDMVCADLYTFYGPKAVPGTYQTDWQIYARANIRQAKRYGKPVYVYLWPRYHESNTAGEALTFIAADFWKLQLETCRDAGVDGIVLWDAGSYFQSQGASVMDWSASDSWWTATKDFRGSLPDINLEVTRLGVQIPVESTDEIGGATVGSALDVTYRFKNIGTGIAALTVPAITKFDNCRVEILKVPTLALASGGESEWRLSVRPIEAGLWQARIAVLTNVTGHPNRAWSLSGAATANPASNGGTTASQPPGNDDGRNYCGLGSVAALFAFLSIILHHWLVGECASWRNPTNFMRGLRSHLRSFAI